MANEKLVPFNLEEARKDPSRVRYVFKPEAPYDLVEFTERGAVIGWRGRVANVYAPSRYEDLQLVAKPVEYRYRMMRGDISGQLYSCHASCVSSGWHQPSSVRIEADGTIVVTE